MHNLKLGNALSVASPQHELICMCKVNGCSSTCTCEQSSSRLFVQVSAKLGCKTLCPCATNIGACITLSQQHEHTSALMQPGASIFHAYLTVWWPDQYIMQIMSVSLEIAVDSPPAEAAFYTAHKPAGICKSRNASLHANLNWSQLIT